MNVENLLDAVLPTVILLLCAVLVCAGALFAFVILPVSLSAQADCLRAGYPEYRVTWNLDRYCMTLDGAVTVRVESLEN